MDRIESLPGDHRALEPPDSISNSAVKRRIADGSVGCPHVRVGHRQAPNPKTPQFPELRDFFMCESLRLHMAMPYGHARKEGQALARLLIRKRVTHWWPFCVLEARTSSAVPTRPGVSAPGRRPARMRTGMFSSSPGSRPPVLYSTGLQRFACQEDIERSVQVPVQHAKSNTRF